MKLQKKHLRGYLKNLTQEEASELFIALAKSTDGISFDTLIYMMQTFKASDMTELNIDPVLLKRISYKQSKTRLEMKTPKLIKFIRTNQNLVAFLMLGWFIFFGLASTFALHSGYFFRGFIFLSLSISLPYLTLKIK